MTNLNQEFNSLIQSSKIELAREIVDRQYALRPDRWRVYSEEGYQKSLRDTQYHLDYLSNAAANDSLGLFRDYVAWVKILFAKLNFSPDVLPTTLELTRQVLRENLPLEIFLIAEEYLASAENHLGRSPENLNSEIDKDLPLGDLSQEYLDLLLRGERGQASRLIQQAVDDGVKIKDIYLNVFQRSQHEVGRLWQMNEISVAHEHYCTAATQMIMSQLYPHILATEKTGRRMVMTCVNDELHELGARMVADFFELDGWDAYYLGANTPLADILSTLEEKEPDLLGISTTITYHLGKLQDLIQAVKSTSSGKEIPILIGGRPFNIDPDLGQKMGADGQATNAKEAVRVGTNLVPSPTRR